MSFQKGVFCLVSGSVYVLTMATAWHLLQFLAGHAVVKVVVDHARDKDARPAKIVESFVALSWDLLLLACFVCQHSMMARKGFKEYVESKSWGVLQRSLYNAATCVMAQILMTFWKIVHVPPLWLFDVGSNSFWWWGFTAIYFVSSFIIYGGSLTMDFAELTGIKQVYYHCLDFGDPMWYKTSELQRFYSHMRHPSVVAIALLLWISPVMTLDRLLLAIALTLFMLKVNRITKEDYYYQLHQISVKNELLQHRR